MLIVAAIAAFAWFAKHMPVFGTYKIKLGLRRTLELISRYFHRPLHVLAPAASSAVGFFLMCGIVALFLRNVGFGVTFWQCLVLCPRVSGRGQAVC